MNNNLILRNTRKDRGIQLLRVLACIAVFVCHFGQRMNLQNLSPYIYNLSQLGQYGVELFFVISGYLACLSLSSGKSIIAFYKKRIVRILPLYYFCILYYFFTETFIFKAIPDDSLNLYWLRYIFCLNGIVPSSGEYFWSNIGITWTIPVFFVFYLLAPLIVKLSKTTLFSCIMLIGFIGLRFIIHKLCPRWFSSFDYLPCFIIGVVVYNAKKENSRFITSVCLLLFVIVLRWIESGGYIFDSVNIILPSVFVISAVFAVMLICSDQFVLQKLRFVRIIDILDEHSYTLYLVHGIVFCGIIDKFNINIYFRIAIAIFGTVFLTIIIHKFIEKPAQKVLKKVLSV